MKKLLFVLITMVCFSCTKEEKEPCEVDNEGELCVINRYQNSAKVLLNGKEIGLVAASGQFCREVTADLSVVTLINEITLSFKSANVDILQCESTNVSLP